MDYIILALVGYLLGSIPFGLIAGRLVHKVDVRKYGSGSTGMTNVWRTVGWPAATIVLLLDMGKSALAVVLATVFTSSPGVEAAAALAALIGHSWPVFSGFKGGKGTAPGWGGLLILSPIAGLVASVLGMGTAVITRWVSLGSLVGASTGAAVATALWLVGSQPPAYAWYGIVATALIVARHRDNIGRLARGQERKLGQPADGIEPKRKSGRGGGLRWPRSV